MTFDIWSHVKKSKLSQLMPVDDALCNTIKEHGRLRVNIKASADEFNKYWETDTLEELTKNSTESIAAPNQCILHQGETTSCDENNNRPHYACRRYLFEDSLNSGNSISTCALSYGEQDKSEHKDIGMYSFGQYVIETYPINELVEKENIDSENFSVLKNWSLYPGEYISGKCPPEFRRHHLMVSAGGVGNWFKVAACFQHTANEELSLFLQLVQYLISASSRKKQNLKLARYPFKSLVSFHCLADSTGKVPNKGRWNYSEALLKDFSISKSMVSKVTLILKQPRTKDENQNKTKLDPSEKIINKILNTMISVYGIDNLYTIGDYKPLEHHAEDQKFVYRKTIKINEEK